MLVHCQEQCGADPHCQCGDEVETSCTALEAVWPPMDAIAKRHLPHAVPRTHSSASDRCTTQATARNMCWQPRTTVYQLVGDLNTAAGNRPNPLCPTTG